MSMLKRKKQNDRLPSQVTDKWWLYADNKKDSGHDECGEPLGALQYMGKWLIFASPDKLDSVWNQIKQATEKGELGPRSKTGTARVNPRARGSKSTVICVFTKDCRDIDDVKRVLVKLRAMGFGGRLYYKEDAATFVDNYQPGKASLYESVSGDHIRQRREMPPMEDVMYGLLNYFINNPQLDDHGVVERIMRELFPDPEERARRKPVIGAYISAREDWTPMNENIDNEDAKRFEWGMSSVLDVEDRFGIELPY
jgi:hypothetical protein